MICPEPGISSSKIRVKVYGFFEELLSHLEICFIYFRSCRNTLQIEVVGLYIFSELDLQRLPFGFHQLYIKCCTDSFSNFCLNFKYLFQVAVIIICPNLMIAFHAYQTRCDPYLLRISCFIPSD